MGGSSNRNLKLEIENLLLPAESSRECYSQTCSPVNFQYNIESFVDKLQPFQIEVSEYFVWTTGHVTFSLNFFLC